MSESRAANSADLSAEFASELRRTVERLSTMPLTRLDRADEQGRTPADRAHETAQQLVDLSSGLAGEPRQEVPRIRSHASSAQLAVVGHELADRARSVGPADRSDALAAAARQLRELRQHL